MDPDALKKSLITVSIEGMRFARTATRAISKLEAHEQTKYIGAIKFFKKSIDEQLAPHGIRFVSYEGVVFDPGFPVTALNLSDFSPGDLLYVDQTLEPTVIDNDVIVRMGSVILKRGM